MEGNQLLGCKRMEFLLVLMIVALAIWYLQNRKAGSDAHRAPALRGTSPPDLSMLPIQFVVFDLETTGLHADRHEIIEIAAIRVNRDADQHDTFTTLVMPEEWISASITELTGIDRKMIKADSTTLSEALPAFREFVAGLPLVAFNARFDASFFVLLVTAKGNRVLPIQHTSP